MREIQSWGYSTYRCLFVPALLLLCLGAMVVCLPTASASPRRYAIATPRADKKVTAPRRGSQRSAAQKKKSSRCQRGKKPCRPLRPTPTPVQTATPIPMPTSPSLSEEESCRLQVVDDHIYKCCGDWEAQPDENLWYSVFRNCTDYAYDLHRWCQEEGYSCLSIVAQCAKSNGEPEPFGHALVLVKLGDSWALVDPTSGVVVGTVPGATAGDDHPSIPDALICKAMGKTPDECGCKPNGTCSCRAASGSSDPELPNTDPAMCVRLALETKDRQWQNLTECSNCCDDVAEGNEKYGPDLCWAILPRDGVAPKLPSLDPLKYLSWLGQCAKWYEDIVKSRDLCKHACRAEFSGDQPCRPHCVEKHCGDDGCGGSCGECEQGEMCSAGKCVSNKKPDPNTRIPDEQRTPTPPA